MMAIKEIPEEKTPKKKISLNRRNALKNLTLTGLAVGIGLGIFATHKIATYREPVPGIEDLVATTEYLQRRVLKDTQFSVENAVEGDFPGLIYLFPEDEFSPLTVLDRPFVDLHSRLGTNLIGLEGYSGVLSATESTLEAVNPRMLPINPSKEMLAQYPSLRIYGLEDRPVKTLDNRRNPNQLALIKSMERTGSKGLDVKKTEEYKEQMFSYLGNPLVVLDNTLRIMEETGEDQMAILYDYRKEGLITSLMEDKGVSYVLIRGKKIQESKMNEKLSEFLYESNGSFFTTER